MVSGENERRLDGAHQCGGGGFTGAERCAAAKPAMLLALAADLGRVVHVHQGRGAGARPGDADRRPPGSRGADARAAPALHRRHARHRAASSRQSWRWLVVVALVNTALPFWLLSWGETRIDSGLASIIQAAVPIFNALIAFVFIPGGARDRLAARRRRGRLRRGGAARRRPARRKDARRARDRRDGVLLRPRRPAGRTAPDPREADRRRVRDDRDRDGRSAAGRRHPGSERGAGVEDDRLGRRARRPRDGARVPALLRPDHAARAPPTPRSSRT